jgi:hypothetical protein
MKSIIELAKQAGIDEWWNSGNEHREVLQEHLEHLAALVLEEAARVIEDWDTDSLDPRDGAAAIRALKGGQHVS